MPPPAHQPQDGQLRGNGAQAGHPGSHLAASGVPLQSEPYPKDPRETNNDQSKDFERKGNRQTSNIAQLQEREDLWIAVGIFLPPQGA